MTTSEYYALIDILDTCTIMVWIAAGAFTLEAIGRYLYYRSK